jgi:hypothetical protein
MCSARDHVGPDSLVLKSDFPLHSQETIIRKKKENNGRLIKN